MLGLAEGRVHAIQVANVAPLEHHGHVPGERAVVVPDGGGEFRVLRGERAQRITHCLPAPGFDCHRFCSDSLAQGCIQSDFHAFILTPRTSVGNTLMATIAIGILRETVSCQAETDAVLETASVCLRADMLCVRTTEA
jgi:hypothetical protein